MDVLITGGCGRVGTAILDNISDRDEYEFTILDLTEHPEYDTHIASVTDYESSSPAFDGSDVVIHLAVHPSDLDNEEEKKINEVNIQGTYNVMKACRETGVEKVIFASTNHVVGGYEDEHAPEIYGPNSEILLDHTTPVRPDSYYAVSKLYCEQLGKFCVEQDTFPEQFLSLRICSLRHPKYDHPYGDAEKEVEKENIERNSKEYSQLVGRLKSMWFSRRDCAQMIERMLYYNEPGFDIFYGLSGNSRRWHDIEHARETLGYRPLDNGEEWTGPP